MMTSTTRTPSSPGKLPPCARRGLVALFVVVAGGVLWPAPAGAHAELTSSDPANASTVTQPVTEVTLTFSKPSEPDPGAFSITGPDGDVAVESVEADDAGLVMTVRPSEPLAGGRFRISWGIRAGDTHTMSGAISVTVPAAPAATNATASATATPDATGPATATATATASDGGVTAGDPLADRDGAPATSGAERVATLLRWVLYLGLLGAVGGTAYLSVVHRGPRAETRWLVFLVHRAAAAAALASLVAVPVHAAVLDGSWGGVLSPDGWADALGSGFGVATALRLCGAGLVLAFLGAGVVVPVRDGRGPQIPADIDLSDHPGPQGSNTLPGSGSTAVLAAPAHAMVVRRSRRDPVRIAPAPLAWLGAALLIASESFVGHTADTAPQALMVVDDAAHLAAAGLWFGGVALLAATSWRRRGAPATQSVAPLAARFSFLAAWSLVVVAATGVVMGVLILGEVGAVWSSAFGRVLVLKVALVGGVAGLGAYHRRAVLPRLEGPDGTDPVAMDRFRTTLVLEVLLFVAVVGLTAVLVAASPVNS